MRLNRAPGRIDRVLAAREDRGDSRFLRRVEAQLASEVIDHLIGVRRRVRVHGWMATLERNADGNPSSQCEAEYDGAA